MRKKLTNLKSNKAITLIALVITIIVLLILAGVTIATLTGDNGLLQKATNAKQANEEASALEKIQVEVAGSYGLDGKIDLNELNKNLKHIEGLVYEDEKIENVTINELPAIVKLNGINFKIYNNGEILSPTIGNLNSKNYGDYIDLGLSVVGTAATTDDWRILYNDKSGHVVYAILADYLPNNNEIITESGLHVIDDTTYNVNSTISMNDLIDKLCNTTVWQNLIPEELRNVAQVKGAATVEIIMGSYNEKYNTNLDYNNKPHLYVDNDSSKGVDSLYMPHPGNGAYDKCWGYWLASTGVWNVDCTGLVNVASSNYTFRGVCPVVSLSADIQVDSKTENGKKIWSIIQ